MWCGGVGWGGVVLTMFGVMGRLGPFDPPFSIFNLCRILIPTFRGSDVEY